MPLSLDKFREVGRRLSQTATKPLLHGKALSKAFPETPKEYSKLPAFYLNHLRELFRDPKKLKLALTDITPLGLFGLATTIPAIHGLTKLMPHRKVQTITGGIGNLIGGQLMQRTGLIGSGLGGLVGEAVGRIVGSPFDRPAARPKDIMDLTGSMIDARGERAQAIENKVRGLIGKSAMEHQGIREPNPTTHDESIGSTNPRLLDVPLEYGNIRSVKNRGKWRPDIDTLNEALLFLNPAPSLMAKDRFTDPTTYYNQMDGLHHDPLHLYENSHSSVAGISGVPGKRIKDRGVPET